MRIRALLVALLLLGCKREPAEPEKTYPMTATIVARDASSNAVTLDNKEVPGVMEPMRMDYSVRGAKVGALPPDGAAVDVTLHEQEGRYWITDVKPKR